MKKRYYCLISFIFLMFLLFLFLASAAELDKWIECTSDCSDISKRTSTGAECRKSGEKLYVNSVYNYCCSDGAIYRWQGPIPCCTDYDGDYYVKESISISLCGYVCGPTNNVACVGNKDCNDDDSGINPGISESTDTLCSDGIDNN